MKIKRKSIVKLPPAEGSVSDTANVEDEITNAPSIRLAKEMGLNGVPIDSIIPYDGDEIPEGFEEVDKTQGIPFDLIYPVGSIYLSTNSINPGTLFGGTWERINDVFLWGTSDNANLGKTGGEATVTLTVDQIPSHSHTTGISATAAGAMNSGNSSAQVLFDQTTGKQTTNTGGGQAHNNMPPYLEIAMWKRIA